ncbi:hypothetical protein AB1Y20_014220 [Prymnesium parvum]|uniref:Calmodulin-lysine N-methyltransferase n=1 Tax=Prymnesium parvum TaxID=97485 RepID=A0AB34IDC7_PRYPA
MLQVALHLHGTTITVQRRDPENDDGQDPNFFDQDYSVAASTGGLLWEGSWAAIELLRHTESFLSRSLRGKRVVELGAGVGLLGLCAAAGGAHVLLTDVPAVVSDMLLPNIAANASAPAEAAAAWPGARSVGSGSALAQPLDWQRALAEQCALVDPRGADVILAAECVWLNELVDPFVSTVVGLMQLHTVCILAFRERAVETSQVFASARSVLDRFRAFGFTVLAHGDFPVNVEDAPESVGLLTGIWEISRPQLENGGPVTS